MPKKIISKKSCSIELTENYTFANINHVETMKSFEEIKKAFNCIDNFDDYIWQLYDYDYRRISLVFAKNGMDEIVWALKIWCIYLLDVEKLSIKTVMLKNNVVRHFLKISRNASLKYIDETIETLTEKHSKGSKAANAICEFLNYFPTGNSEQYIEALQEELSSKSEWNPREIISYDTLLKLDYIFYDYFSRVDKEERLKYYPLLIWWELTRLIPMRPTELCLTEKECL